jgi:enamine deaminase RidA (YjgF/YER057c/UK114 family)
VIRPCARDGNVRCASHADHPWQHAGAAENVFTKIEGLLKAQGFALGDVVMMRVYMAADPAMDSKLDFAVYRRRRLCAVF